MIKNIRPRYPISRDFTWDEMLNSATANKHGIDNVPDEKTEEAIVGLVKRLLQPLRLAYGQPIRISSGYRCPQLNKLVGGVASSQHVKGEAADCVVNDNASKLLGVLLAHELPFDQAILYKKQNFLHLSIRNIGTNRRMVLIK
ncbi:uncharacterized protein YcbK (DUF882 family) [Parabacteroides sp. PF5-5]|uniref:D-Ala-D-Ala carboxypeptidase family metallohydrolase n=1 Tax=unclassified Parabacteroides TaxID=2649774 RepID=UPI002475BA32|nr:MULTISPECIES: D-Ala-D-Ala carboxypeptidase family metallohydrolase [unclassified Parabacteroides]MDH6306116.1 uncharacterized protein YcbK (DUF882 family) [Parabacteroides sp. PH5-39]MDH6316986.1 uncharacterized protein YcbK (DUF882 family) [Parabacteroides sp. PF5-13]MDH6320739.1 uncharacterized protein YcbK (DUF882 family) [Parabacteroides sp. PH5-13]MDH6324559.1 uncharacterized protein YcbK (DUF882 family) [Parabacteroides sp. PH5-8]MDH6328171.1 uncharacterized protein YcbK (DUF882 famil